MVQAEVTVGRVASGPLASGKSLGVTGATVCGSKTSVRSSDLPLWQVTVASHTADCYPQPRFVEPSRGGGAGKGASIQQTVVAFTQSHSPEWRGGGGAGAVVAGGRTPPPAPRRNEPTRL